MEHAEEEDTADELMEHSRLSRMRAEELCRIASIVREQAQKLRNQTAKSAQILAAKNAGRVKKDRDTPPLTELPTLA